MAPVCATVPLYPPFVTISTDRSSYGWGGDVSVTVTVCNPSPDAHTFHIRGGPYPDPRFDFAVYNSAGQEVWRHSRHVPMTWTYWDYTLAPGESVKFPPPGLPQEGLWAQLNNGQLPVDPGQYYIIGEFGQGNEKIISDRAYFVIRDQRRPGGRSTSEYMLGTILPVIVFVEARRAGDHALAGDFWTPENMNEWLGIVQDGGDYWKKVINKEEPTYEEKVQFLYPYLKKFAIDLDPGESSPIESEIRPEEGEEGHEDEAGGLNRETVEGWLTDFVESVGLGEGSVEDRIYAFLNDKLEQYPNFPDFPDYDWDTNYPSADWGFVIFVVDDRQYVPEDGGFGGTGDVARAALGGPWIIATYSCASRINAYPPDFRAALVAHEIGHVFWALDEYAYSQDGSMSSGYFNILNSNHADQYGGSRGDSNTWYNGPPGIMKRLLKPVNLVKYVFYEGSIRKETPIWHDFTPGEYVVCDQDWGSPLRHVRGLRCEDGFKISLYNYYYDDLSEWHRDQWDKQDAYARYGELEPGPWVVGGARAAPIGALYSPYTFYAWAEQDDDHHGWFLKAGRTSWDVADTTNGDVLIPGRTYLFGAYVKVVTDVFYFVGGIRWELWGRQFPFEPPGLWDYGLIQATPNSGWQWLSHKLTIPTDTWACDFQIRIYLTWVQYGWAHFYISYCPGALPDGEYPGVVFEGSYLNLETSLPTRQMLGWVDSDSNNIPDAIECTPSFHLNPHFPSPTVNYRPKYTGYARMAPTYHNQNTWPHNQRRDIIISTYIRDVKYIVDTAVVASATPFDGAFDSCDEDFWFHPTFFIIPQVHSIGLEVTDSRGRSSWQITIDQIYMQDSCIAFTSTYSGDEEVYVKQMGFPWMPLYCETNNPGYIDRQPAWSTDQPLPSSKIAFVSDRPPHWPDREIYVMNYDGSNVRRLTNSPNDDMDPEWLPDGRIVFSSRRDNNWEIYIMNSDGSGQTRLTNDPGTDQHPTSSPIPIPYLTGQYQIAFESDRSGHNEIWVMNADGTNQRQLTGNHDNYKPDWSPMGDKIAFVRLHSLEGLPQSDIWIMNIDGTGLRDLTQTADINEGDPDWSPDATLIAYYSATLFGDFALMVMNADGSDQVLIASGLGQIFAPAWYPRNICPTPIVFHPHTELWFTWYDFENAQIDNIHFTNPSDSLADITVFIAGVKVDAFTLDAGQSAYKNYPGVCDGPVHIVSTQPILASERVVGWDSFKEVSSLPGDKASREIYYTWYDMASPGAVWDAIHFVNPSTTSTAHVNIYIAGELEGSLSIDPGGAAYETYPGLIGGPVRITSDIPIFSTQRIIGWSDFQEIAGIPSWYAFKEHWFTWYDMASPGADWDAIHFINPTASTASIEIYIAGQLKSTIALSPREASYAYYPGVIGGPVRVVSDQPIMVTRRILGWNGFKELFGTPSELMSTKWHFEWYDMRSASWDAIHFINPSTTETAHITVTIGGTVMGTLTLNPTEASCVTYPGVMNGPVLITSDVPIMATQRILGWSSFEETIGMQWT